MMTSQGTLFRGWRLAVVSAAIACGSLAGPSPALGHDLAALATAGPVSAVPDTKRAEAVPPTVSMSATPSGTGHESFTLAITFSESVTGFRLADIDLNRGSLSDFSGSGSSYTVTIEPPDDFEGTITVTVAEGAAQNAQDEDNKLTPYSFFVDNVRPELRDAFVDGDELVLVFDDDLDVASVPGTQDFRVRVDGSTETVSDVDVGQDEVTLTLASPVAHRNEVTVSYTPGTPPLSDAVGNPVEAIVREPVTNRTTQAAGAPSAPRSLSARADGTSVIELNWTAPADSGGAAVDGYRIEVSSNAGSSWSVLVADTRTSATSYRHTGLGTNTTRDYRVMAINDIGISEPSNTATATTVGRVPGAPTGLGATAVGSSRIDLNWRAGPSGSGGATTGYQIEVSANGVSGWSTLVSNTRSTLTRYSDTGLAPGTRRFYRVSAINRTGVGSPSNVAGATTGATIPGRPQNLRAGAASGQITLTWTGPTETGGSVVTGYTIESSSDGGTSWTILVANTRSTVTSYIHRGLAPGSTRHYRVAAVNSRGRGPYSNVVQASTPANLPGRPGGLRFVALDATSITLAWNPPLTTGGAAITDYRIEVSRNGGVSWQLAATTAATSTQYTHTGLEPATPYHYRVAAINRAGIGPFSAPNGATTAAGVPGAPRNLSATAVGSSRIDLRWIRPADDGGARITGYRIEVSEDRRRTWSVLDDVTGANTTRYSHTGLPANTTRHYRVAAVNRSGPGRFSNVDWATTGPDLPGAPTGLEAAADGTSRIDLSWTAPTNTGGVLLIGYRIEVSDNGGRSWRVLVPTTRSTGTTYSHIGLLAGTTRHYRVSAINQVGVGKPSGVASATTESSVPGVPTALSAAANGTSRIDLSWRAPAHDGGRRISGYRIEVSENGGTTWSDLVANSGDTNTDYAHTGLEPATTRHYRVSAINALGAGEPSDAATATTDATVPDAPTGLVATAVDATQIDLAWTAPAYDGGAPITGYRIEVSEDGAAWADLVPNTGVATTSYLHIGLEPGSTRFYRVSAINSAGTGMPSGVASASTDDGKERSRRVGQRILRHAAAAITSSTVSAIAARVEAVALRDGARMQASLGSASSLLQHLAAGGPGGGSSPFGSGRTGMPGIARLLDGASFVLPAGNQSARQPQDIMATLSTWGGGDYAGISEPQATDIEWSGNLTNLHVGADVRVRPDVLAGVAATTSLGSFDFTDRTGTNPVTGTYDNRLTTVNPYAAWLLDGKGSVVWATAGYGWGNVEMEDDRVDLRTTGTSMLSGAAGGSHTLLTSGLGNVRVRGEGWVTRLAVDEGEEIDSLTLDMQRVRLLLEWSQGYRTERGDEIAFLLEGGMRYDGGGATQSTGAEVGSGMRLVNAGLGVHLEVRGRALLTGQEGYQEWGVGATLQIDPEIRGEGLSLRVAPTWGEAASGARELWERGVSEIRRDGADPYGGRLDTEISYGLRGFTGTPYGGLLLAGEGLRAYSSGMRYDLGSGLGLRVEVTRREGAFGPPEHAIGLRGRLRMP